MVTKLGERIARHRVALGWTQQELADRIALSRTAVSHFEMDLALPSERTIVLLAGVFKCEPPELVADTYYPSAKTDRLPSTAALYTEAEKELCVLEHEIGLVNGLGACISASMQRDRWQHWLDRVLTLHGMTASQHERQLLERALQTLRRLIDAT